MFIFGLKDKEETVVGLKERMVMKGFVFLKIYNCLMSSGRNIHILSL